MNESKEELSNPHPSETYKYTYRDMLECWISARENLVRWGVGDGDMPGFSSWCKDFYHRKVFKKFVDQFDCTESDEKNSKYE